MALLTALKAIIGPENVAEFEEFVKAKAKEGAEKAIPTIERKVKELALPYAVGGAMAVTIAFIIATAAFLLVTRKKSKGLSGPKLPAYRRKHTRKYGQRRKRAMRVYHTYY